MEVVRKIINRDELASIVDIPKSFQSRKVELLILPFDENVQKKTRKKSTYGILKKYANPALIAKEDGAWSAAMKEKHAIR